MGSKNGKSTGLWIPENIKNDKKLDWTNKALLSEIYSLCKLADGCFASDKHFGNLLDLGRSSVNKRVNWLKEQGYINAVNHYKENLIIGRTITKGSSQEKHTLVPKRDMGSSQSIQGVVPMRDMGSSVENTTNTTTNSDKIIQKPIQNTGKSSNSGMSMNEFLNNRLEQLAVEAASKAVLNTSSNPNINN
jgi:biotin operon repressor